MKKISLKDVAQKAGVSTALVSYVINNRMGDHINKATADRVKQAIKELNYQPNRIAQSLKLQKTFTLGLIVPDIANPFSSTLARLIEDDTDKSGYTLLIGSSDEKKNKQQSLIDLFLNRQVDGLIIGASENSETQMETLQHKKIPFVLIDRYFSDLKTDAVAVDNYGASVQAVTHLIQQGCKRIAIVTYETEMFHLQERLRGYKETLEKNNIAIAPQWIGYIPTGEVDSHMPATIEHIFREGTYPDAIYFTSNSLAIAGLKKLVSMGISIPRELAVIAFDETEAFDLFYSPVSFIRQPLNLIAETAVNLLLQRIQDPDKPTVFREFPAEMVIRKSSMPHPARD